jgi:hypothetical protein
VVSEAVLATSVAVVSSKVYRPMRARVRPAPAVVPDDTVIADKVNDETGVKNIRKTLPEAPPIPGAEDSPRG